MEGNLMHHFFDSVLDRSPYWYRASSLMVAGLLNRRSVPALVFGNAITSRIDCALQRIAIKRSNPSLEQSAKEREVKVIIRFRGFRKEGRNDTHAVRLREGRGKKKTEELFWERIMSDFSFFFFFWGGGGF